MIPQKLIMEAFLKLIGKKRITVYLRSLVRLKMITLKLIRSTLRSLNPRITLSTQLKSLKPLRKV